MPQRKVISLDSTPFKERIKAAFQAGKRRVNHLYTLANELLLSIPEEFFNVQSSSAKNVMINQAIKFINRHDGCVSNAEIAAELHLSPNRFCHLFKDEMDIAPQRYCHRVRMCKAVQLLQEGNDIKSTAESCGYADRYHFSKEFKRYHNMTPGKWVKIHIKNVKN